MGSLDVSMNFREKKNYCQIVADIVFKQGVFSLQYLDSC